MPDDVELAKLGQRGRRRARCASGISDDSGRSGTSDAGKIAVKRPRRLDSKKQRG